MSLRVIDPGFFTTIQGRGRVGWRAFGVPLGGAADRASLAIANALTGNPDDLPALETTLRGGTFEALDDHGFALAGATMEAAIVHDGGRRPLAVPGSATLRRGERLVLGRALDGARTYLAVPGGVRLEGRSEGASSEPPLKAGDVLIARSGRLAVQRPVDDSRADPDAPIGFTKGPDWSLLANPDVLIGHRFRVDPRSNRMGLRLSGPAVATAATPERLSAPVTPGTIQAAGGTLLMLGVACGTMGGYPHVAQVISADLDRLGRLRPGDPVTFQLVSTAEARRRDRESREVLHRWTNQLRWAARVQER